MTGGYVNRFGRRPGRGIRPWLLLPKVIAAGLYLGGLAALLVVWTAGCAPDLPGIGRLLAVRLIVPAAAAANVLGMALLLQHPRIFLRMRWMQVKLLSVAVLMPASHLFLASRLALMRDAGGTPDGAPGAASQFAWGLALALAGSIWVIVLGRLKPRLGRNPAARRNDNSRFI